MIDREEILSWLNKYKSKIYSHCQMVDKGRTEDNSSELSLAAAIMYNQLIALITSEKLVYAIQVIERMEKFASHSTCSLERGEIWVKCGMAFFEMGNYHEAAEALKHAVAEYSPISHQHAVSRVLLGAVQWRLITDVDAALKNCSKAIDEFEMLAEQADKDHHNERRAWYRDKTIKLKSALSAQIQRSFA